MALRSTKRKRRLSMTSLIDVIFLLLLFFMLSSTFSQFAEVEISAGGAGQGEQSQKPLAFLRLGADGMFLNGQPVPLDRLADALGALENASLLVSVTPSASAQSLTDVLVMAQTIEGLPVTVLEAL